MESIHKPVLLKECIEGLDVKPDGVYIDGTIGGAGHSAEIYGRLGPKGILIGIDKDEFALDIARKRLEVLGGQAKAILVNDNFGNIENICARHGIEKADGILLDLGVSSFQLDDAERGFSYQKNAPLDMRMDRRQELNAGIIVNEFPEEDIRDIIRKYGEERWAARIASFIAKARKAKRISSTSELAEIIKQAVPSAARRAGPHPAKRTFQALRIAVNNELEVLGQTLDEAVPLLKPGGRLCVITFHSLEDRIVKEKLREKANPCICPPDFPECVCGKRPELDVLTKKPILPEPAEIDKNPRARSAKLRVAMKL